MGWVELFGAGAKEALLEAGDDLVLAGELGLEINAFKDSISTVRFLIPDGIADFSPGWRSVSDENPGILVGKGIRPRQAVAEGVAARGASDILARLSGCKFGGNRYPGWSSLALLDPGLISAIPVGIKKTGRNFPNP